MSNSNEQKRQPSVPHLPTGSIKAKAIDLKLSLTDAEDKEMLNVRFEITADGEHKGQMITSRLFFTDATIETTFKAMRAMGWGGVDPTDHKGMDKEVLLVIEHEADDKNGGRRSIVRWINALGLNVSKPLEGNKLQAFRARVGALAQRAAAANGTTAQKLPPVDNGNDIPTGEPPPWMRS